MQETIKNRTIFGKDNLDILRGVDTNSIDLIYLDPPFNKKKVFTAPIGSSSEGASFSDIFREEDIKDEWLQIIKEDNRELFIFLEATKQIEGKKSYNFCYLSYMAIRLIELHRVLKDTGSIYLHCDNTMSHYLKLVMDYIFNENNFRNEIIWCYRGAGYPKKDFGKRHDIIFRYSKEKNYLFNLDDVREEYAETTRDRFKHYIGNKRGGKDFGKQELNPLGKHPDDWWQIQPIAPSSKERLGYPTQKPLSLLERIIKASSKEGDTILDPFCGCATTCIASERLNRKWIGIDVSVKAYELVQIRLKKEVADPEDLFKHKNIVSYSQKIPKRTDKKDDNRIKKWVYVISNPKYKGMYKVGIASNLKSRLSSYQTSDPLRQYKIEFKHLTPLFRETEKYIHDKYKGIYEWVSGDLEDIKQSIEGVSI